MQAALDAVSAERLVSRALSSARELRASAARGELVLIAAGKAASAMVRGFTAAGLDPTRGLVTTTHVPAGVELPAHLDVFLAGHPVPTAESAAAGARAVQLARGVPASGHLVVLLSGGASALLAAPAPGLTLDEKMAATRALLAAGAPIHELNAVRKHLSSIKGGRLAAATRATCATFAISDVVGPVEDDPSVIGSGPTMADTTTFGEALAAVERLGVRDRVPAAAIAVLEEGRGGERPETPKPGDPRLSRARFSLIGSRRDAMEAARREGERRGYTVAVLEEPVIGEARDAAAAHLARARALADRLPRPCCIVSSGETTVRVTGSGRGGRNQEFALALAPLLARETAAESDGAATPIVVASVGSDGVDGPTDAAGAIVDVFTAARAAREGLPPAEQFLRNNDAYRFFDPLGDLVRTGPTDTNVGDLQVILFGA